MKSWYLFLLFAILPTLSQAKEYQLYFLGGQSNMDGFGFVRELDESASLTSGTRIFHGNPAPDARPVDGKGIWSELQPGHGVGFKSDGTKNRYSNRFGVELTFASRIRELRPNENIAIIKYSRGGTSIAIGAAGSFGCWDPDFQAGQGDGIVVRRGWPAGDITTVVVG